MLTGNRSFINPRIKLPKTTIMNHNSLSSKETPLHPQDVFSTSGQAHPLPLVCILLLGGHSSRMGSSKAELLLEGETFGARIARGLSSLAPVYLSCSADTEVTHWQSSYPRVVDRLLHIGPMGGMASAMEQIEAEWYFFCACDMPLMSAELPRRLLEELKSAEDTDALLIRNGQGRIYPIAGLYHRRILPEIKARIAAGDYRLWRLLEHCRVCYLEEETLGKLALALTNVNTPEDFARLT